MKIKERIKSYSFWISLASAVFLVIKVLGQKFGFSVDETLFNDIITSMCSILVILGIIVPPGSSNNQINDQFKFSAETISVSNETKKLTTEEEPAHNIVDEKEEIIETINQEVIEEKIEEPVIQMEIIEAIQEPVFEEKTQNLTINNENPFNLPPLKPNFENLKSTFAELLEVEKNKFSNKEDFFEVLKQELEREHFTD